MLCGIAAWDCFGDATLVVTWLRWKRRQNLSLQSSPIVQFKTVSPHCPAQPQILKRTVALRLEWGLFTLRSFA